MAQVALDGVQKLRFKRLKNQKLTRARCLNCGKKAALVPDRWICRKCYYKMDRTEKKQSLEMFMKHGN